MRAAFAFAMILAVVVGRSRADCEVRGEASVGRLRVRVAGAGIHTFAVEGLPIVLRPGHGSHSRLVRVLGPLEFEAHTDARIPWTFAREGSVGEGLLWWTPTAQIEDARDEAEGAVEVRVRLAEGVMLGRLRVPCDALRVGSVRPSAGAPPEIPRGPRLMPRDDETWIWSGPGQGVRARLELRDEMPEPFVELGRSTGWIHVAAELGETGAVLRGWVLEGDLRVMDPSEETHAHPLPEAPDPENVSCDPPAGRGEYRGQGRVTAGTLVRDRPDGSAWAMVPRDVDLQISWRPDEPWARIVSVRGLRTDDRCPEMLPHAWVPRRAVRLQGEN